MSEAALLHVTQEDITEVKKIVPYLAPAIDRLVQKKRVRIIDEPGEKNESGIPKP